MPGIFDSRDYKAYIRHALDERGQMGERGSRSRLAEALGCQSAYVSRVLEGDAHFSLEQAERLNGFFAHSEDEGEFFFLLVQRARAGSAGLRRYFDAKIEAQVESRLNLAQRLKVKNKISEADQAVYFSRWQNAAAHVALLVPSLATDREALAKRLGLKPTALAEIIDYLVSLGLFERSGGRLEPGSKRLHLGKESPLIANHHVNWRLRAIDAIERDPRAGLHYSSVVSLSRDDLPRGKEILVEAIERVKKLVRESKEETIASFCTDFYEF
jgi:uncharacterized protein (TIGR02147 family)